MHYEATYICNACGEEIVIPLDLSQGSSQKYVEDCPVCCRPTLIHVDIDDEGEARGPACVLVINKNQSVKRKSVLFINADREYKEGKNQNSLRPEDIEKITHVYRNRLSVPKYSREVPVEELEREEFNLNLRRYVDNSPPPEPHDVRARLNKFLKELGYE